MKERTNISAPWVEFYREVEAMFNEDPAINTEYDEENLTIVLRVEGQEKADALTQLLPKWKSFGNVTIRILVLPANDMGDPRIKLFQKAFEGSPAFRYTASADDAGFSADYVVFAKKVVQFFNDDLSDAHGMKTTLYEDIAKDIFEDVAGIFFCTDTEE